MNIQPIITGRVFKAGQIWKIGEINLAVTLVGKILVHYKQYKLHPRGARTTITSKTTLDNYLLERSAVLQTDLPIPASPAPAA